MVKTVIHTFQKMNKDIAESKNPVQFYYDAHNIRFITNEEVITGGFSFEKGNDLILNIPNPVINSQSKTIDYLVTEQGIEITKTLPYETTGTIQPRNELESNYFISDNNYRTSEIQIITGHCIVRNNIILFTTDNNGFDCIWKINDNDYTLDLLYLRNLSFSTSYPIQCINNYENENIDKIYWVDSKNQMRFVNIYHSIENQDLENLIDLSFNNVEMVGSFNLSQPEIIDISTGGIHTSGMIQYAYNLYKINGSQTKISPLTELISLDKGDNAGGGDINELIGSIPVVRINNIDTNYTNLRLYAIKYTSYNQTPSISLILDRDITSINEITYYDDGNIISTMSLEEFLFLGSDIFIPKHINTKKNIMFLANYKEKNFDINTYGGNNSIDTRAFSFEQNTTSVEIYNSLEENNSGVLVSSEPSFIVDETIINNTVKVPFKYSSININYDINNFQYNNSIPGGEGPYLKYRLVRNQINNNGFTESDSEGKFLKDNEIYRLAVQFYNKYGQNSLPKWIGDFKNIIINNQSNLNGYYASVEITLKQTFYDWLNNNNNFLDENGIYDEFLKPIGYRLLRSERTLLDRTILCQGLLNGMMAQLVDFSGANVTPDQIEKVNNANKIPSMMRRFDDYLCPQRAMESYARLDRFDSDSHPFLVPGGYSVHAGNEVYKSPSEGGWTFGTFQFNKLMQLFSPEITFNSLQTLGRVNLKVIGGIQNNYNAFWGQRRSIGTQVLDEAKVFGAISIHDVKSRVPGGLINIAGVGGELSRFGWFGPRAVTVMEFSQTFRQYTGNFISSNNQYTIYGTPEINDTGEGRKLYNNNADFTYYNSLEQLATDTGSGSDENPPFGLATVNTWGAKNISLVLGTIDEETETRKGLEDLYIESNINDTSVGLVGELVIERNLVYLANIYGGNSYESKRRSNYIEIGEYQLINNNVYNCIHAGDTFIANFKFTKLVKTETQVYSENAQQVTEIVEFKVETTIDLKNRNDFSLTDWDNRFQPTYNEYQKYNTVYSQDSNLIIRRDTDYKFKKINSFDTNIIASKTKTSGEIIDSWTDLLPNEIITLDGKYGPINNLVSFKDELYTYQDKSIAQLSILPRVQVTGNDGIAIELGSGNILQDYKYLTINSGSINKWGIISTETGMYYLDALNKSFNYIGESFKGLSDSEGFHKYFLDNINIDIIKEDNPILYRGVSLGWDKVTNDVYISIFNNQEDRITLSYNLAQQGFSSFYNYDSSIYIFARNKMITVNPNINNRLYQNFIGQYNIFYDNNELSSIDFIVNPEPQVECTFNNLEYKSEASGLVANIFNTDINYTWERIRINNEFQDSNLIPLQVRSNIRKLNRKWRLNIPRNNNKVNRIRNTWSKIHLESNNFNSYNYRNHDIIVYYNPNYKIIQ